MSGAREIGRFVPGEVFGERYLVESLLKAGGMGAVYVVKHVRTDERLALKVMRPELVAEAGAAARFEQEARIGALIQSPGIVRVIDAGVDRETGIPFLVMELLRGHELGELLRLHGRIDAARTALYLGQVARTLDKAHAAGVVHRDVKPDNLFVVTATDEEPERVKILDFGIAKLLLAAHAAGASTQGLGTPLYMAPEQTKRGAVGPPADIWPLGLLAYAMIVGQPFWEGETTSQVYGEILRGDYESPTTRAARVGIVLPNGFDEWFFLCVTVDPAARFPRATDASTALAKVFGVAGVTTGRTADATLPPIEHVFALGATAPSQAASLGTEDTVAGDESVPVPKSNEGASGPVEAPPPEPARPGATERWVVIAAALVVTVVAIGALVLGVAKRGPAPPLPTASSSASATAPPASYVTAKNPVLTADHPDPSVLRVVENGRPWFYLVATVGNAGDIPIWKSSDLVHWQLQPEKLLRKPSALGSSVDLHDRSYCSIWAPELVALPSGFMLHFTAQRYRTPQSPCPPYREDSSVYLASSDSVVGPFARDNRPWEPIVAGGNSETCKIRSRLPHSLDLVSNDCAGACENIVRLDSSIFSDESRWWLSYSYFTKVGPTTDAERRIAGQHVRVVELDPQDPFAVRCEPNVPAFELADPHDQITLDRLRTSCPRCGEMLSFTKGRDGEEMARMGVSQGIVEGPSIFRRNGMVYALLSHSGWNSAYYSVMWIAAKTVAELSTTNPKRLVGRYLVPSRDQSFGHGSPVLGPDGEHWYYVHHHLDHTACGGNGNCGRDVWVSPIEFEDRHDGLGDVWIKSRFPAEQDETVITF